LNVPLLPEVSGTAVTGMALQPTIAYGTTSLRGTLSTTAGEHLAVKSQPPSAGGFPRRIPLPQDAKLAFQKSTN
jgi:hypothetical protein